MSEIPSPQPSLAHGKEAEHPHRTDRLTWRCRRGLLELDLWLGGFLAASRATLQANEMAAFERLLAMSDMHIMDMLQGLSPVDDASLHALIGRIKQYRAPNRDPGNEQNSHPQF